MSRPVAALNIPAALSPEAVRPVPVYRRAGVVASLAAALLARLPRRSGRPPPVPEGLRRGVGLVPPAPQVSDWWRFLPK
jgi:hypothetical protein